MDSVRRRIAVFFGGRSSEAGVSILSAASILSAIDRKKNEIFQVFIAKDCSWHLVLDDISDICELSDPRVADMFSAKTRAIGISELRSQIDFAFPCLHGRYGEDGTIQGLFEMLDLPYAGGGVAFSSICMDKLFTKQLASNEGLPICKYIGICKNEFKENPNYFLEKVLDLGLPVFVKPANMGSSVGISKANTLEELEEALHLAFSYDRRVIVEEEIVGRELEVAILGGYTPQIGKCGEIVTNSEYYDFSAKYQDSATKMEIPARLEDGLYEDIKGLAERIFRVLDGYGFARIDLFLDEEGKLFFNEVNTIPGFTKFSMYPLLMTDEKFTYEDLIERIIDLGYERYKAENKIG